jgi:hypothetical protein
LVDTDGDGISDGDEMGKLTKDKDGRIYYARVSNPIDENSKAYDLGPSENPIAVWDSGFRSNVNGLSFYNFTVGEHEGYCAGMSYLVEQVYNGNIMVTKIVKDDVETEENKEIEEMKIYGYNLSADYFETLITSKRLYDYKMSQKEFYLATSKETFISPEISDYEDLKNEHDYELICEIALQHIDANSHFYQILKFGNSTISEKELQLIENYFSQHNVLTLMMGRITGFNLSLSNTVSKNNHAVTAYALEKMDEAGNNYRLYIYDNNFPYNPDYIRDNQNGNTYITLTRNTFGSYDYLYEPVDTSETYRYGTKYLADYMGFFINSERID